MFAIVRTGGKQFRVAPGDKIVVDRMAGEAGDSVTLDDVLFADEGGETKSTQGLKVSAEIVAQAKGEKVTVFKKKRRHNYRRKRGHRQLHTILRITAIGDAKAAKKSETAAASGAGGKAKATKPAKEDVKSEPTAGEMTDTPKAVKAKAEAKAPKAKAEKAPKAASTKKPSAGKSK
jgi:large subunit ribosomal protein L21